MPTEKLQPEELEKLRALCAKAEADHSFLANAKLGVSLMTWGDISNRLFDLRTAIPRLLSHIESLERAAYVDRESLAQFMLLHSFATGHGDTIADLLGELDWQLRERLSGIEAERERSERKLDGYMREASYLRLQLEHIQSSREGWLNAVTSIAACLPPELTKADDGKTYKFIPPHTLAVDMLYGLKDRFDEAAKAIRADLDSRAALLAQHAEEDQ